MKKLFGYLYKSRQVKNIAGSLVFRAGAIACNYLIVPILISSISSRLYGVLITILSVSNWFTFIDFGLANGLKNKLSKGLANGDMKFVKQNISTAYIAIAKVTFVLCVLLVIFNLFLNWNGILDGPEGSERAINNIVFFGLLCFFLKIIADLINTVLIAFHKVTISSANIFISQFIILLVCTLLREARSTNILFYGLTFFIVPLIVLLIANLICFKTIFADIAPSVSNYVSDYQNSLLKIGGSFFIIQIAVLVVFSTDNLIIGRVLGYDEVTNYNIAFRYFNIPVFLMSVIVAPYWPVFAEKFVKDNILGIKDSMKKLFRLLIILIALAAIMLFISKTMYHIWVKEAKIPFALSFGMFLFAIITMSGNVFATFVNSTGKLKVQLYANVFTSVINIPLSVYFCKYTNLGAAGVIYATCVCLAISSSFAAVQYYKMIHKNIRGIWNK